MWIFLSYALVAAGAYAAAVFTWEPIHTWFIGVEAKVEALRQRAKELAGK